MGLWKILFVQIFIFASFFLYNAAFFNLFNSKQVKTKTARTENYLSNFDALENINLPYKNGKYQSKIGLFTKHIILWL
jgi:hypothetical protein